MNANRPSVFPDVPGIDDCDHLLSATTRNGKDSLYMRLQEFEWEGATWYSAAMCIDSDSAHFCEDIHSEMCFSAMDQAARCLQAEALENFGKGNYCFDTETKRLLKRRWSHDHTNQPKS